MSARLRRAAAGLPIAILTILLSTGIGLVDSRAQTASPPSTDVALAVYATALRFYDPARGQVRWLESPMIDETGSPLEAALDPALEADLLARLGDDFRPWTETARGSGGRLRVSPLWTVAPDTFRVTVSYRHRTPHFEGSPSYQSFLVGRVGERWRILARGPARGPETP